MVTGPDSQAALQRLHQDLHSGLAGRSDANPELVQQFAQRLLGRIPTEELDSRDPTDLYGATLSCWHLLETHRNNQPLVVVTNPNHGRDGWDSSHTMVQILHPDMPFITDSVLMELTGRSSLTHNLFNVVLRCERDANQRITGLDADGPGTVLLYAEIDRLPQDALDALEQTLLAILADVRAATGDFQAMRQQLQQLAANLPTDLRPAEELEETQAFLHWLGEENFTFLGYREFQIDDQGEMTQVANSALGVLRNRPSASPKQLSSMRPETRDFLLEPTLLSFSKSGTRARVHRRAYPDYVAVKKLNSAGQVVGEHGFLGLYTSPVYNERPERIPVLRQRVAAVRSRSGLNPKGFDGKTLHQVLSTFPRDELFQSSADELLQTALAVTWIHERRRVRVFLRRDRYGLFVNCLVYMPRDLYNTRLRVRIQRLLVERLGAVDAEFSSWFSESLLVRTQFTLRVDPTREVAYDPVEIQHAVETLTRDWALEFRHALIKEHGESQAGALLQTWEHAFPTSYREHFTVRTAVYDLGHVAGLTASRNIAMRFYRPPEDDERSVHLKLYHAGAALPLSDILPMLEHLGLRVLGVHNYLLTADNQDHASIQDFACTYPAPLDLAEVGDVFEQAFIRTWSGAAEDDEFNRLVSALAMDWRDVALLRAYARYMKQIRFGFSQAFIAETLGRHPALTQLLVQQFHSRHNPDLADDQRLDHSAEITAALDQVALLNEDRILRRYHDLIQATLRSNFYQLDDQGAAKAYIALKLDPRGIVGLPRPRPAYEVFVYSPQVEGVHLRGGAIARGGLRWSDRHEDFRTEVLGLVKAQVVKNAVIVPTGAKGGFVVKRPPADPSRDAQLAEGISCYRTFISALLDITDNYQDGQVVPPARTRRLDGDDPYLVVAADKGTATFSDIANEIAEQRGFWLGDAFASGGSNGYDHKKMGITAKGAWVSVQRHFAEQGVDVQRDPVTVVGIGDMSGDVFGNGMLLSDSLQVVAAFNHMHIFLDPNPDAAASHAERSRLFALPRSSWEDYNSSLLSSGGGIFSRQQKAIPLSPEVQARLAISEASLAPDALISALLKAPVDLLWNGGIGSYAKASSESHEQVGDRANDTLRVDARDLRCKVFGEGGNLGLTQAARVEFALCGGAVNTDFIDNSAGVDCSDHEVNIKILLNSVVTAGDMTVKQRNRLLQDMTEDVAELVLDNNRAQAQAISLAQHHSKSRLAEYRRFLATLEAAGKIDRQLEGLPSDDELAERAQQGHGFTRPELAVLLCYAKINLKEQLLASSLHDDASLAQALDAEFPPVLADRHRSALDNHRLRREIVCTQVTNDLVHHMGITFVTHLQEFVGGDIADVVKAWNVAAAAFAIRDTWQQIEQLTDVPAQTRLDMMQELMRLGRRSTRWLIRHCRNRLDVGQLIAGLTPNIQELRDNPAELMGRMTAERWQRGVRHLQDQGVPETLAGRTVAAASATNALPIIDTADSTGEALTTVASLFQAIGHQLRLDWLMEHLLNVNPDNHWQAMERDALMDDLTTLQGRLCSHALRATAEDIGEHDRLDVWLAAHTSFAAAWRKVVDEAQGSQHQEFALYTMLSRKLADLASTLG